MGVWGKQCRFESKVGEESKFIGEQTAKHCAILRVIALEGFSGPVMSVRWVENGQHPGRWKCSNVITPMHRLFTDSNRHFSKQHCQLEHILYGHVSGNIGLRNISIFRGKGL